MFITVKNLMTSKNLRIGGKAESGVGGGVSFVWKQNWLTAKKSPVLAHLLVHSVIALSGLMVIDWRGDKCVGRRRCRTRQCDWSGHPTCRWKRSFKTIIPGEFTLEVIYHPGSFRWDKYVCQVWHSLSDSTRSLTISPFHPHPIHFVNFTKINHLNREGTMCGRSGREVVRCLFCHWI